MLGGGELVGRVFGKRAGGAIGRVDELDQISVGGLEDVHDGAALAACETMLGQVLAQPDAVEAPVPAERLPTIVCRGRIREPWGIFAFRRSSTGRAGGVVAAAIRAM